MVEGLSTDNLPFFALIGMPDGQITVAKVCSLVINFITMLSELTTLKIRAYFSSVKSTSEVEKRENMSGEIQTYGNPNPSCIT